MFVNYNIGYTGDDNDCTHSLPEPGCNDFSDPSEWEHCDKAERYICPNIIELQNAPNKICSPTGDLPSVTFEKATRRKK